MNLEPTAYFSRVSDIPLDMLISDGVGTLVVDVDNTLMPYDEDNIPDDIAEWMRKAKRHFTVVVISNTKPYRAKIIRKTLHVPAYGMCMKPLPISWLLLRRRVPKDKPAVVIGDQFFTDGLYAKWNNLKFIKVEPLSPKEAAHTKVTRWLEKILFISNAKPSD